MKDITYFANPHSWNLFDSSCDSGAEAVVVVALREEDVSYFTTSAPSEGREKFNNSYANSQVILYCRSVIKLHYNEGQLHHRLNIKSVLNLHKNKWFFNALQHPKQYFKPAYCHQHSSWKGYNVQSVLPSVLSCDFNSPLNYIHTPLRKTAFTSQFHCNKKKIHIDTV